MFKMLKVSYTVSVYRRGKYIELLLGPGDTYV
jgi:hypothetical protein